MAAYFIAHGTVTDQTKMSEYVEKSGPIFASFGGEFVTVGGVTHVLIGSHSRDRVAMFKFPNSTAAEACYNSDAYKALWPLRQEAGDFDFIGFEEF
jgi:uncharacterized protein (DUF1330 family)